MSRGKSLLGGIVLVGVLTTSVVSVHFVDGLDGTYDVTISSILQRVAEVAASIHIEIQFPEKQTSP